MSPRWTQADIIESAVGCGSGFFRVLSAITYEVFDASGAKLTYEPRDWYFPMDMLTVGQIVDFFASRGKSFGINWQKAGGGLPEAFILVDGEDDAAALQDAFSIEPVLTPNSSEDDHLRYLLGQG